MKSPFAVPVAAHLFLIRQGKILLLRRQNTGYEDGKFSVVAGHLDGGEEVSAAMIREAREEAGIDISPSAIEVVGVMHRLDPDERVDFFLSASSWTGEITNMEPDKCAELGWFDLNDLPADVVPYVMKAIDNYRRGIWFDSFGWRETGRTAPPLTPSSPD